jgi:hypothetical protein
MPKRWWALESLVWLSLVATVGLVVGASVVRGSLADPQPVSGPGRAHQIAGQVEAMPVGPASPAAVVDPAPKIASGPAVVPAPQAASIPWLSAPAAMAPGGRILAEKRSGSRPTRVDVRASGGGSTSAGQGSNDARSDGDDDDG